MLHRILFVGLLLALPSKAFGQLYFLSPAQAADQKVKARAGGSSGGVTNNRKHDLEAKSYRNVPGYPGSIEVAAHPIRTHKPDNAVAIANCEIKAYTGLMNNGATDGDATADGRISLTNKVTTGSTLMLVRATVATQEIGNASGWSFESAATICGFELKLYSDTGRKFAMTGAGFSSTPITASNEYYRLTMICDGAGYFAADPFQAICHEGGKYNGKFIAGCEAKLLQYVVYNPSDPSDRTSKVNQLKNVWDSTGTDLAGRPSWIADWRYRAGPLSELTDFSIPAYVHEVANTNEGDVDLDP